MIVLGSTGSIGTQALEIARRAGPDVIRPIALAATGRQPELLAAQANEFGITSVAVSDAATAAAVRAACTGGVEVLAGDEGIAELAARSADVVLNGIAGAAGLAATLAAVEADNVVGLANKESLTVGGAVVLAVLDRLHGGTPVFERLRPVDSEHSALWQCLAGMQRGGVAKLVLTASGGPFRGRAADDLWDVRPEDALKHPTWSMGPLVTINSATLVNKGLELIEAALLFGRLLPGDDPFDAVDVVVHPQSLVHSMVTAVDGSTIAQLSPPDMQIPIALAIAPEWRQRIPAAGRPMDWTAPVSMTFEPLNTRAFPAVELAREAGRRGGTAPAVFTAANEAAVAEFLEGNARFPSIVKTVEAVLAEHVDRSFVASPSLEDILTADHEARLRAVEILKASA